MSETINQKQLSGRKVFFIFVAFFAFIAGVNAIFITQALRTHAGVVESRTYERGLEYNTRLDSAKAQEALGWQETLTHKNEKLVWSIKDKNGIPVTGAEITARIVRPVQKGYDYDVTFKETAPGLYETALTPPLPGLWEVKAKASWRSHTYHSHLEISAN